MSTAATCIHCMQPKMYDEFPDDFAGICEHMLTWCLQCLIEHNRPTFGTGLPTSCPEITCRKYIKREDLDIIKGCRDTLLCPVFHDLTMLDEMRKKAEATTIPHSGAINVALLDGQRCSLEITRNDTLQEIKKQIHARLGIPVSQQRLMHGGRELKPDSTEWREVKVSYGSVLQVVVVMYEASVGHGVSGGRFVQALNFELTWIGRHVMRRGRPTINHLNGSCLAFSADARHEASVDFTNLYWGSVCHHGRSSSGCARQMITVNVASLPRNVDYLFFTLSAYAPGGITLADFEEPKVELRDALTHEVLANYIAKRAVHDEAVILCCAKRDDLSQKWRVQRIGKTSSGCVKYPAELISSIKRLILNHDIF